MATKNTEWTIFCKKYWPVGRNALKWLPSKVTNVIYENPGKKMNEKIFIDENRDDLT